MSVKIYQNDELIASLETGDVSISTKGLAGVEPFVAISSERVKIVFKTKVYAPLKEVSEGITTEMLTRALRLVPIEEGITYELWSNQIVEELIAGDHITAEKIIETIVKFNRASSHTILTSDKKALKVYFRHDMLK